MAMGATVGAGVHPALASKTQRSIFEDDRLLLWSGDDARSQALDEIKALGADTVHALVVWNRVAPQPNSTKRPAFDATDPAAYWWQPFDSLVQGAAARGLDVILTPTGRAPAWASQCGGSVAHRQLCSPRPSDYRDFVTAVGRRYPAVGAWSFWNEPNHKGWLIPQSARRHGVRVDTAAIRYRALVQAGVAGLSATGHGGDLMLLGETAPIGGSKSTGPVDFYRDVFCLDRHDRALRGGAARLRGCAKRPRFAVGGVAHHPYTYAASAFPSVKGAASDAPIGALSRITKVLDAAARYHVVPRRTRIWLTEFGFQTRPPDRFGMTLEQQARFLNFSDYLAFKNPRIASVAQYGLRDDPSTAGFNTGLRFTGGKAKPALAAYRLPLYLIPGRSGSGRLWGQVRGAPAGTTVEIRKRATNGAYVKVAQAQTNAAGYFLKRFAHIKGHWRIVYGSAQSRVVDG